ncbi:RsmB/NOP family class I SAM-dependent RNA methyltransferase [Myxococcus sp. K15C18031901]|uniref:RsmB/NOP family class I SAM-dependent RNA methyltransferase n=1 Tax=Myxococcus dinghuensis TaxID=2906761 RepID=UPI0020A74804|nr:class I SAM-dependent methyltransferase [Myxococcus dinghuensis]MCP3099363.1 RsmB/NOP family class I SAM-dependent RNA methyltransferase [Myxococcus dinghuensis]
MLRGEPLKAALANALRDADGLGGQERRFAALVVRELSRHQRLLDLAARTLGHPPGKLGLTEDQALVRYALWRRLFCGEGWTRIGPEVRLPGPVRPRTLKDDVLQKVVESPLPEPSLPDTRAEWLAIRYSFPTWLVTKLTEAYPESVMEGLLASLDEDPGLHFRVRPPGTRDAVLAALAEEGVAAEAVPAAPDAVRVVDSSHRVFETRVMKTGRLQVQDVGSQLISEVCRPVGGSMAGLTVADVCAGAGGKTLALADFVGATGRVVAGDRSRRRLAEARERVRHFSLRQVAFPHPLPLSDADVLLIDAPCSGTGSLAREPDQKWKLTAQEISKFQTTQSELLEEVARQARPGALVVYATCSVLPEEDEVVVEAFLAKHPEFTLEPVVDVLGVERAALAAQGPYLKALPPRVPGGGFFAARLRRAPQG